MDSGKSTDSKVPHLDKTAATVLLAPSDVLGDTAPVIAVDGRPIQARTAVAVKREIFRSARTTAMSDDNVTSASASTSGTQPLIDDNVPSLTDKDGHVTAPALADTALLNEEDRLLQHSNGDEFISDSITQSHAWQITLEDVNRLVQSLEQLDLEVRENIDELVCQRSLINEAAREVRDVPTSLPEALYQSARTARNSILQSQVRANRAVRQIDRWPSDDLIASVSAHCYQ